MAYPAPENVAAVDGTECFIVWIPNDPAYRRAALDAYTNLANRWMWGEEEQDPNADLIEQQWLSAIYETLENMSMGFCTTLLSYLDEVEDLLKALNNQNCCPPASNVPVNLPGQGPNETDADGIQDNVGDPPAYHGETATSTWEDWLALKCPAADYVAQIPPVMMGNLDLISAYQDSPGWAEIIGQVLGKLPGVGEILKVAWEVWLGFLDPLIDWVVDWETAVSDLESARATIKCAAYTSVDVDDCADRIKSAVDDALTGAAAKLIAAVFPYKMWATMVYTGWYEDSDGNQGFIADSEFWDPDADCSACLGDEEATGIHFHVGGGVVIDKLNSDTNVHETEVYTNHVYRLAGNHATVETFQLSFTESDHTTKHEFDVHITAVEYRINFTGDPVVRLYDDTASVIETINRADIPYSGVVNGAAQISHYATRNNYSPNPIGYIEFYVREPA